MSFNSIIKSIWDFGACLKFLEGVHLFLNFLIVTVVLFHHLDDITHHVRIETDPKYHPTDAVNLFPPISQANISISYSSKSLKGPVKCYHVLLSFTCIKNTVWLNPSTFCKRCWLINKEPEAWNQMCHEDNWTKYE